MQVTCALLLLSLLLAFAYARCAHAGAAPRVTTQNTVNRVFVHNASLVVVSSTGTDSESCGLPDSPCFTLQYALDNIVASNATIMVQSDLRGPGNEGVVFPSNAFIAVVPLIGSEQSSMNWYVSNGTAAYLTGDFRQVTLEGFRFIGCTSSCIVMNSSTSQGAAYIHYSTFEGLATNGSGAALRVIAGSLTAVDCVFGDNFAAQSGGSIFVGPRGSVTLSSVKSSSISMNNNRAVVAGGAIFSQGRVSIFASKKVSFYNNTAYGRQNRSADNMCHDEGYPIASSFSGKGGAIALTNDGVGFDHSLFISAAIIEFVNNEARRGCGAYDMPKGGATGGAIFAQGSFVSLSAMNSMEFRRNIAYQGGAIFMTSDSRGLSLQSPNNVSRATGMFVENVAADEVTQYGAYGGAIYAKSSRFSVEGVDLVFLRNVASSSLANGRQFPRYYMTACLSNGTQDCWPRSTNLDWFCQVPSGYVPGFNSLAYGGGLYLESTSLFVASSMAFRENMCCGWYAGGCGMYLNFVSGFIGQTPADTFTLEYNVGQGTYLSGAGMNVQKFRQDIYATTLAVGNLLNSSETAVGGAASLTGTNTGTHFWGPSSWLNNSVSGWNNPSGGAMHVRGSVNFHNNTEMVFNQAVAISPPTNASFPAFVISGGAVMITGGGGDMQFASTVQLVHIANNTVFGIRGGGGCLAVTGRMSMAATLAIIENCALRPSPEQQDFVRNATYYGNYTASDQRFGAGIYLGVEGASSLAVQAGTLIVRRNVIYSIYGANETVGDSYIQSSTYGAGVALRSPSISDPSSFDILPSASVFLDDNFMPSTHCSGVGVFVDQRCSLNVKGSLFSRRNVGPFCRGGGLFARAGSLLSLFGTQHAFQGNIASNGGGIYLSADAGDPYFDRSGGISTSALASQAFLTVEDNVAEFDGGGLYLVSASMRISGGRFSNNTASLGRGGAIFAAVNVDLRVRNVDFLDNRAARAGGAVALGTASNLVWSLPDNALSPDVSTVRFARNHADTGGAIAVDFRSTLGFLSESDTLLASLLSVAFYNNSATSAGGALFLLPVGESFLPSATFVGNRVTGQAGPLGGSYAGNGGCIYASSGSTFGFSGKPAVFSENSASGRGGSIFLESDVMFDDCDSFLATFSHNAAALAGGAVYYSDPVDRCNLSNANYAANIAPYGPDVASIDSELILVNTLPASFVPDHAASFIIPVKPGIPFSVNAVPLDRFGQQVLFSFTQYQLQIKDCPSTTSVVVNTNYQGRVEYADLRLTGHPGQLCSGQIALAQSLDGFQVSTNLTFVFDVCDAGYGFLNGECVACKPTVEFSVVPSASPCLKCPSSTVAQCTPTSLSWNEGFWFDRSKVQSPTSSSVQVYDCDPTVCLDGGVCGTYRKQDSLLCSECQQGYSEWNGQCIPCEEAHGGVLFGMLLVFWLFVIVQHFVGQTPTGATRILFTFVQMLSFVLYPSQLTNGIGLLSFDAVSPSSQQCPYPRDGYGVMFTSFATPFLMLLMLLVTCGLTLGIRSIIRKRTGRQVIMRGTSRTILLLRSLSSTESFVRTCVNMILFGFQTVASVSLAFVNCRQLDDTSVVATQPDIVCWDHSYRAWAPFYILSIIIAGVAPFVIGLWLMRSNRQRKRSSLPATQKFAFSSLTVLYRPSRYLWEAVDLLRRVVFIVLFTSFSTVPDLNVRRQLLLLAIAVSVALNWVLWPYRLKRDNVLSLVAWSTLMIIAILTGSDDSATRNITASRVLAWLCIVVLFCGILWRPLSRSIRWSRNRYGTQQHSRSAGSGSAMGHSAHELSGDLMLSSPDVGAEDGATGSYEPPSLTTSRAPNDI